MGTFEDNYKSFFDFIEARDKIEIKNLDSEILCADSTHSIRFEVVVCRDFDYIKETLRSENWIPLKDKFNEYLHNRLSITNNPYNRARYLAVLGICFHQRVKKAFDVNKELFINLSHFENKVSSLSELYDTLFKIASLDKKLSSYDFPELISSFLADKYVTNSASIFILHQLKNGQQHHVKLSKISGLYDKCEKLLNECNEPFKRKNLIETCIHIYSRLLEQDKNKYKPRIKELYEQLADNEYNFLLQETEGDFGAPHQNHIMLQDIVSWYKLSGNVEKFNKATKELIEVKSKLYIPSFPVNLYNQNAISVLNKIIAKLNDYNIQDFIFGLAKDFYGTFMTDDVLVRLTENFKTPEGFQFSHLDYNHNSRHIEESNEFEYKKFFIYDLYMKCHIINFGRLILERIKNGILKYKDVKQFLINKTFFGMEYGNASKHSLKLYDFCDVELKELFRQFSNLTKGRKFDFTLSICSLSIKIERIVREILQLSGFPTMSMESKGHNSYKEEVKFLEEILNSEDILKIYSMEDINFIKYVLTKNGRNLRNYVAHGIPNPYYYKSIFAIDDALLLLIIILRLAVNMKNIE